MSGLRCTYSLLRGPLRSTRVNRSSGDSTCRRSAKGFVHLVSVRYGRPGQTRELVSETLVLFHYHQKILLRHPLDDTIDLRGIERTDDDFTVERLPSHVQTKRVMRKSLPWSHPSWLTDTVFEIFPRVEVLTPSSPTHGLSVTEESTARNPREGRSGRKTGTRDLWSSHGPGIIRELFLIYLVNHFLIFFAWDFTIEGTPPLLFFVVIWTLVSLYLSLESQHRRSGVFVLVQRIEESRNGLGFLFLGVRLSWSRALSRKPPYVKIVNGELTV